MRIYRRSEFLKLPPGTIYAQGKRWFFGQMSVKGDTIESGDWACLSPMWIEADDDGDQWRKLEGMLECGASEPIATSYGRDGRFDEGALFLVPEVQDLERLRDMIDSAIAVAKK